MKSARIRSFSGPYYPAFGLNTERCGVSSQDILINGPLQNINPAKFQSIDEEIIRKAAIRTKGIYVHQVWMPMASVEFLLPIIFGQQIVISVRNLQM